ncbi:MAG: hypothetical protein ABSF67_18385 [Roseiarcus sp.]|jgi:hypothetical protein
MTASPSWLSLDEALRRLVARGREDGEAKTAICEAIADLRLRIRIELAADSANNLQTAIAYSDDVDMPAELNPTQFDWAASRPSSPAPWHLRAAPDPENWRRREIARIEANADDLAASLCGELDAIVLPDQYPSTDRSATPSWLANPLTASLSALAWKPTQSTIDSLSSLRDRKTVPLSEAVALMSGVSSDDAGRIDDGEVAARGRVAELALFWEARSMAVPMRGVPAGIGDRSAPIPPLYFSDLHLVARDADTLTRGAIGVGAESQAPRASARWANVHVDADALARRLQEAVCPAREQQLKRQHSIRLFEHPLWSIQTALRWIAFRDSSQLEIPPDEFRARLHGWSDPPSDTDAQIELHPEILLLQMLRRGRLAAWQQGVELKPSDWLSAAASNGDLLLARRGARLQRQALLRKFRENESAERAALVARRKAKIERIAALLADTRRWISCREIDEWLNDEQTAAAAREIWIKRPDLRNWASDPTAREKSELIARFVAEEWRAGLRSRLRLLTPYSSLVLFSDPPLDRRGAPDDSNPFDDDFEPDPARRPRDPLGDVWMTNEACRELVHALGLEVPARFEKREKSAVGADGGKPNRTDIEQKRKLGRPPKLPPYEDYLATMPKERLLNEPTDTILTELHKNVVLPDKIKKNPPKDVTLRRLIRKTRNGA